MLHAVFSALYTSSHLILTKPQIYNFSPVFFPELQTHIANCLLSFSIWLSNRHLRLNSPKNELGISSHNATAPSTAFYISLDSNFILPVAQAETLSLPLTSLFLSYDTSHSPLSPAPSSSHSPPHLDRKSTRLNSSH